MDNTAEPLRVLDSLREEEECVEINDCSEMNGVLVFRYSSNPELYETAFHQQMTMQEGSSRNSKAVEWIRDYFGGAGIQALSKLYKAGRIHEIEEVQTVGRLSEWLELPANQVILKRPQNRLMLLSGVDACTEILKTGAGVETVHEPTSLMSAFSWNCTPQGYDFWSNVNAAILRMEDVIDALEGKKDAAPQEQQAGYIQYTTLDEMLKDYQDLRRRGRQAFFVGELTMRIV